MIIFIIGIGADNKCKHMINKIYINDKLYNSNKTIKSVIKIQCNVCLKMIDLKCFQQKFITDKYICQSCNKKGENNPFYGKKHTNESKKLIGGAVVNYNGKNNPFYGKKHTNETINKLKNVCANFGSKNGFYGKKHSNETIKKIKDAQKLYRENHSKEIFLKRMDRFSLTEEKLLAMLDDYINNQNKVSFSKKYNMDFRTASSFWIRLNILTEDELKKIKVHKKLNSNPSTPEKELYNLLRNKYGELNVVHHYDLNGYFYDICIFKKILIEYDGYYWHKILKNKNDKIKNRLAKKFGYTLYRVEEDYNRKVDFANHLSKIDEIVKLYETNKN